MARKKRNRSDKDRPVADRAAEAGEELGPEGPVVTRLADNTGADDDRMDAALAAGVTAAGESDRPAGVHVPPEYPVEEVRAEIDVDAVYSLDGHEEALEPDVRLEGRADPPDEPVAADHPEAAGPLADDDLAEEGFAIEDDEDDETTARSPRNPPR